MPRRLEREFVLVPFVREKSHHIVVEARLGGRAARFVVDTGAGGTVLDANAVAAFKVKLSKASRRGGGVGSISMRLSYVAEHDLTLAGLDLSDERMLTLDLSHVNAALARSKVQPVVGVLGADLLWRRRAVIDYERSLLLLSK